MRRADRSRKAVRRPRCRADFSFMPWWKAVLDTLQVVVVERHVSMNQFSVTAIAEKVSALKTEAYFRER